MASWRRFRRRLLASGGRSGAGDGEGLRGRRPMYITYPIILGLARLRLVSFVLVLPMRSLVSLHRDVDEGDGGGGFFCITGWRYVVHLFEKSGWCLLSRCGGLFPFWLLYWPTTRGRLHRLRRLFLKLSAMRRPMAVEYCLCVQRSKCRSKLSMCQSLRHQKTLKLLHRDGDQFQAASSSCSSVSRGGSDRR